MGHQTASPTRRRYVAGPLTGSLPGSFTGPSAGRNLFFAVLVFGRSGV